MDSNMSFSNASIPIATVLNDINTVSFGGLDLQPSYQRGYVWNNDFKDKLIYSIIKQYPTGNISIRVLNQPNGKGAKSEVVDGQQRLTTIKEFVQEKYIIKSEWSKKIIAIILDYYKQAEVDDPKLDKLVKKFNNKRKVLLKYNDLPDIIKGNLNAYNIALTQISNATDFQIREYFRFLQNQERLRAGEIINSMPASELENFLKAIVDKDKFLDIIGFVDNRSEFDKIFYSIIGLFDNKISFGTTDKAIQNYASNAVKPITGKKKIDNMVNQINFITNLENPVILLSRKRFLKFLLLLTGFGYVDFKVNAIQYLQRLKEIDDKLSVFFSAKANAIENEFKGYSQDVIEEFRLIALLTKGGHSLARVDNRMQILAYYIENFDSYKTSSGVKYIDG